MSDPRSIAPVSGGDQVGRGPADLGGLGSLRAFLQKAMRFVDHVAGDGELEVTTAAGEHLASVDLCKEFAGLHGCEISDEAYSIALGCPLSPAPVDEPRHGGDASAAPGRSPAGAVDEASSEVEAPDNTSDLSSLRAEIETLRTALAESERRAKEAELALKPFTDFAQEIANTYPGWDHDAFPLFVAEDVELTLAPFRAASALLSALIAREAEHGR